MRNEIKIGNFDRLVVFNFIMTYKNIIYKSINYEITLKLILF